MGSSVYLSPIEAAPEGGGRILQAAVADLHAAGRGVALLSRGPAPSAISGGVEAWRGRPPPPVPPPRDCGLGALGRRYRESRRR